MNAVFGTLRAALRLRGTVFFWGFYGALLALTVPILTIVPSANAGVVAAGILGFAAWMGWLQLLARLWQLQHQAESLQLPAARRHCERAGLLLGVLGTSLPALLLIALGAPPGWSLLAQWLALSTALVYLMVTPTVGVLLLIVTTVLPALLLKQLQTLAPDPELVFVALMAFAAAMLGVGLSRWRRLLVQAPPPGWNAPQVVNMAERDLLTEGAQGESRGPSWLGDNRARIDANVGPGRPLRSLSLLLSGPLAPLGWRSYLRSSSWMLLAIGLLGALMLSEDAATRGPAMGLTALLGFWTLSVLLSLITRLRQLWHGEGHGLAEAALMPNLATGGGRWPLLAQALIYTTLYRLWLPALLIAVLMALKAGQPTAALPTLLICAWALLLICCLLPLARRRGGLAGFALYAGIALVLVGSLAAQLLAAERGVTSMLWVLPAAALPVLMLAAVGWRLPRPSRPLLQP
ncbi:hypothetical protein [Aquimonas sp.]|uniref:hypothetical protein n=1 Tax=Aquimonas sp. TaxID=1872588 RepID=UPI0037C0474E